MLRALKSLFFFTVITALVGAGGFLYVQAKAIAPGPQSDVVRLRIEPGMGLKSISAKLSDKGLIREPYIFRLWARRTGQHKKLKAGEFEIPAHASIVETLNILQFGPTVVRKLTFAEGLAASEMLLMIQNAKGLSGGISHIPENGTMLPETYYFSWGDRRDGLIKRMTDAMDRFLAVQWLARPPDFVLKSKNEWLTLASLVEKETGISGEREKVAAVFLNRLKKGMRLQSDPTVVFALTQGKGPLSRALTRQDLKIDSPYNTYKTKGLPPAPIANPGRESLLAVLNPAQTKALYFVADGTGGHVFAKTLKEHNRNVLKWRKIKREAE